MKSNVFRYCLLLGFIGAITVSTTFAADRLEDRRGSRPASGSTSSAATDSSSTVVELLMQLDTLQNELKALRNQVEIQQHELNRLKSQQVDSLRDVDKRLQKLETGNAGISSSETETSVPTVTTPRSTGTKSAVGAGTDKRGTSTASEEQKAYDKAFGYMKQGKYEQATKGFRDFLEQHPKSRLASNAQYWVAEANYVVRNFKIALEEFNKVVTSYPKSAKVSDAKLKIGYCYYELEDWTNAKKTLTEVVRRYPSSRAGKSAQARLAKMKQEGR